MQGTRRPNTTGFSDFAGMCLPAFINFIRGPKGARITGSNKAVPVK